MTRFWLVTVTIAVVAVGFAAAPDTRAGADDEDAGTGAGATAAGGGPAAMCAARGYPAFDAFPSLGAAVVDVDVPMPGPGPLPMPVPVDALGPAVVRFDGSDADTVVCRSDPLPPGCTSTCVIETEIVQLGLQGHDPMLGDLTVEVNPFQPSLGRIEGASVDPLGGIFGGDSFFDLFLDVRIDNAAFGTLEATTCLDPEQPFSFFCQPFRVTADLTDVFLPPVEGVSYGHPYGALVDLWVDPDPNDPENEFIVGRLMGGCHKPYEAGAADEHHLCVMGLGETTSDGSGGDCLQNNVRLVAVDLSRPAHTIVAVTALPVGPVSVSPFVPALMGSGLVWAAEAVTTVEQCTDVGVDATALYADLHTSAPAEGRWRQHA